MLSPKKAPPKMAVTQSARLAEATSPVHCRGVGVESAAEAATLPGTGAKTGVIDSATPTRKRPSPLTTATVKMVKLEAGCAASGTLPKS